MRGFTQRLFDTVGAFYTKPCSHMHVAVQLLNKVKAKILQCLDDFHGTERRLKINPEGGPREKPVCLMSALLFLSTFGHVLDSCCTRSFPRPFLVLKTDENCYLCAFL